MIESMIQSSTVPVLEQVVQFTQARHGVLAGNIANLDTPGYKTRDLSPEMFQERLQQALQASRESRHTSPGLAALSMASGSSPLAEMDPLADVAESMNSLLYHDNSNVSIEKQVTEIAKNQAQHNLALSLMTAQFRLLRAAITERAA